MFLNKLSKLVLACSMLSTSIIGSMKIEAATNPVTATVDDDSVVVGNDYIQRSFQIANGKISTSAIKNKRIDSTLTPAEGSEDFVINTLRPQEPDEGETEQPTETVPPTQALDRSNWSATLTTGNGEQFSQDKVSKLFDGDLVSTAEQYGKTGHPFTLDINLGSVQTVRALSVNKRPGYEDANYGTNGTMGKFELYVSDDGENYTKAGQGEFTREAYNLHTVGDKHNVGDTVYANFKQEYRTQYVRIKQLNVAIGTAEEFTTAEINLYSDAATGKTWDTPEVTEETENSKMIKSSELTYRNTTISDYEGGKRVAIEYEPVTVFGVAYTIKQVLVVKPNDHYMRSFLEISVNDKTNARIDYIDIDRFVLTDATEGVWSHPNESRVSSMWIRPHELMLGQPIYAEGMFMGSEFPAADTFVDGEKTTQVRYYSGKTFDRLKSDHQLAEDDTYVTWSNVLGSATGKDTSVVQTSFFEYIDDIATPTEFRKQYNSWYDNMMGITDESIASSFNGAEKGLTQNGVEPLDSYVVDDGWNNYYFGNDQVLVPGANQGTTPNQTGFWEFNAKFPNELYTSSALASKFQSTFGLWLGPQGGYNYFSQFAQFIEESGTGYKQDAAHGGYWTNVCVASTKYVNNLKNLFIDYQNRFNIDYWKWDGFALRPCGNEEHDHMTGGYENMYYTTDLWEKWIDLFEAVRAARAAQGKGLFINATCYVNLSPWLLQWVNTIWIQDSGDTGELPNNTTTSTADRHQRKIYYRDEVYYKLYKQNQVQFPMKNIYNHDPIYGVSDRSDATNEVFRQFLFANAVRGTAFWELYYSPSIMSDAQWKISADALQWAQENFHILQKAKLIGGRPQDSFTSGESTNGVYGYSSWNGLEGIMAVTNPTETTQTFSVVIDDIIGASSALQGKTLNGYKVLPNDGSDVPSVTYGETWTVEVPAHETVIYQYGKQDTTAPVITNAVAKSAKTIDVRLNERVKLSDDAFTVTNAAGEAIEVSATLNEDYHTVTLTSTNDLPEVVRVSTTIQDVYGNAANDNKTIATTKDGVLYEATFDGATAEYNAISDTTWYTGMDGQIVENRETTTSMREFTIRTAFKAEAGTNKNLVDLGGAKLALKGDAVEFTVGDQVINSKETVTTVDEKAHGTFGTDAYVPTTTNTSHRGVVDGKEHVVEAVREANGMLKIYFDGVLVSSAYDKTKAEQFVELSTIKVGDANFAGSLGKTQVLNYAIGYDETESISAELQMAEANREGWEATACSQMSGNSGDASASAAIDGNTNSWWHTNYVGGDDCAMGDHWIQLDFRKDVTFDHIVHQGRGSGSNGSIKGFILQAKDENGEFVTIKEGEFPGTNTKSFVALDEMVTTSAIKLIPTSTHNDKNFAAAVELNVARSDNELSSEDLTTKKNEAISTYTVSEENLANYSVASVKKYKKEFAKLSNVTVASELTFMSLEEKVRDAKDGLVDVTALKAKITQANGIDVENKTPASKQALADAIKNGEAVAKNALTNDEVTDAINRINTAIEDLQDLVNKDAIDEAIAEANKLTASNYTTSSWADLQEAITSAQEVKDDVNATQDDVANAVTAINDAIDALDTRGNAKPLTDLIASLDSLTQGDYTASSWANLQNAIKDAQAVVNEIADKTEADVTKATNDLTAVKDALVSIKALKDKVAEVKDTDLTGKTDASKATFENALKAANDTLAKANATKEELATALANLEKAFKDLQDKPAVVKPATVKNVKASTNDYSSVKLTWNKVEGADGYEIARDTDYEGDYTTKTIVKAEDFKGSIVINKLKTGQKYHFKVRTFRDDADGRVYGNYSSRTNAIPKLTKAPVISSVAQKTYGTLQVTWKGVAGAQNYYLERRKAGTSTWKHLKTFKSGDRSAESRSLDTGTKYEYRVRASRNQGDEVSYSPYSNVKGNTPVLKTTTATVTKKTSTSAKVSWKTVSGASGYEVYRATGSTGKYVKLKSVDADTKSLVSKSLSKGKTYYYKVRAYRNVNGKKVYSNFSKVVSYRVK